MAGLRRSGAGPLLTDPPDEAEPRSDSARRRRIILLAVLLVLLSPAIYSYTAWMVRPSSLPFGVRSVEWLRADVPFGNQLVDEVEHVYYSLNAPSKGGPQLTSLPPAGRAVDAHAHSAA